jgi:hypothetical protein
MELHDKNDLTCLLSCGPVLVTHEIMIVDMEAVHASQAGGNNILRA